MGEDWQEQDIYRIRQYEDYDAYVTRQKEKGISKPGWAAKISKEVYGKLSEQLRKLEIIHPGMAVLCLGARLGGEVRAFLDMGCFAFGIDVYPGPENPYVMHGDFHHVQFADASIDLVYINCLDHAQDPGKVFSEIHRVLKPDGIFHIEVKHGYQGHAKTSDRWDCLEWRSVEDLAASIERAGFVPVSSYHNPQMRAHPWGFIFRRGSDG